MDKNFGLKPKRKGNNFGDVAESKG